MPAGSACIMMFIDVTIIIIISLNDIYCLSLLLKVTKRLQGAISGALAISTGRLWRGQCTHRD
jgi:hypothetical protein